MGQEHARRRERAREHPAPRPAAVPPTSAHDAVIGLQRAAGNRAVAVSLERGRRPAAPVVQRVHVDGAFDENLLQPYDARNRSTRALTPHVYSQDVHYDLTRGATQVDLVVKIRFVDARRDRQIPAADTRAPAPTSTCCAGVDLWPRGAASTCRHQGLHPPPPATGTGAGTPRPGTVGADPRPGFRGRPPPARAGAPPRRRPPWNVRLP